MKVLLTGANGFIGRNVAAALRAADHVIRPASRQQGVDFVTMHDPGRWMPLLDGVDAVINCVGIIGEYGPQAFGPLHTHSPIALFRACARAGVRRVVQISALGADDTAFSDYHLSKRAADDLLRQLDLDWCVLRPSLIYGRGGGSAALFRRLAGLPWLPVIGDGQQMLQPVHISDVVDTVMRALTVSDAKLTLDVVGPETVSFADWLRTMRAVQGASPARLVRIPYRIALPLAYCVRYLNPVIQPDNLRMLRAGYRADVRPLARFLGRMPRQAEPRLFFSDAGQEVDA